MKPAPILYYFENGSIPEFLASRFDAVKTTRFPSAGPENMRGGMLASPFADVLVEYDKENEIYKWRKMSGIHIGVRKKDKPSPLDFFIPELVHDAMGYNVTMGDGQKWLIPVAKVDSKNYSLPVRDMLDESGKVVREVDERYFEISSLAEQIWNSLDDDGHINLDENFIRSVCIAAIKVFHNIGDIEIYALGLLTRAAYQGVLEAIIDRHGWTEIAKTLMLKKKLPEDFGTGSGEKEN
jgi:hypothetical protein